MQTPLVYFLKSAVWVQELVLCQSLLQIFNPTQNAGKCIGFIESLGKVALKKKPVHKVTYRILCLRLFLPWHICLTFQGIHSNEIFSNYVIFTFPLLKEKINLFLFSAFMLPGTYFYHNIHWPCIWHVYSQD